MSELEIEFQIIVDNGKYIFISYRGDYHIHCLRYGEPWVIFNRGNNAIYSLMYETKRLQKIETEAQKLMESFVEIAKYQNDLLGHGLKEACENWDEATSVSFDITGLKEALEEV